MLYISKDVLTKAQEFEQYFEMRTNGNYPGRMSIATRMVKDVEHIIICDDYHEEVIAIREAGKNSIVMRQIDGPAARRHIGIEEHRKLYNLIKTIIQNRCPKDTIPWRRIYKKDL